MFPWAPINWRGVRLTLAPSYPGIAADEQGRIWSSRAAKKWRRWRKLKQSIVNGGDRKRYRGTGYRAVGLRVNGKPKSVRVHQIVADAFLERDGEQLDHINGDRTDNRPVNLRWISAADNNKKQNKPEMNHDDWQEFLED